MQAVLDGGYIDDGNKPLLAKIDGQEGQFERSQAIRAKLAEMPEPEGED